MFGIGIGRYQNHDIGGSLQSPLSNYTTDLSQCSITFHIISDLELGSALLTLSNSKPNYFSRMFRKARTMPSETEDFFPQISLTLIVFDRIRIKHVLNYKTLPSRIL